VEFTLKPFLRAQGVNRVARLVLTHGDAQNNGGAELLNQLFTVGEIYTSPARFRSAAYQKIVAEFEKPPGRHRIFHRGDTAGCWQVLHPDAGDGFERADNVALVLPGNLNGARVLLLSDLGRKGQNALLARASDLRADVVITGLTDDGEPLCDALLDAVRPKIIVVTDSEFPATRRAGSPLKKRLGERNVPVIYTRTAGAVTLVARTGGWELRTMQGEIFSVPAGSRPPLPPE
jgi:competence protein ComEC